MSVLEKIKEETAKVEEEYLKTLSPPSNNEEGQQEEHQQEPPPQPDVWEHKYNVLQGKYNAEVPRLHQELKQIKEENSFLRGKLELLENMITQKGQPAQQASAEADDPDIKQLKEDFPEIYKALEKLLTKKLSSTEEKITQTTESRLKQVTALSFYDKLSSLVPDWQALNQDQEFLDWLREPDLYTGRTKHELMLLAFNEGDANRVALFFNEFKKLKSQQPNLSAMTAPPRGQNQAPVVSTNKPIYTETQINQFYRDKSLGKISKEEADRIEKEILNAFKEGRIKLGG